MNEIDRSKAAKALIAEIYDQLRPTTDEQTLTQAVMFRLAKDLIIERELAMNEQSDDDKVRW